MSTATEDYEDKPLVPTKTLTEEMLANIVNMIMVGNFPHVAANALGVSEDTWTAWKKAAREGKAHGSMGIARLQTLFEVVAIAEARSEVRLVASLSYKGQGWKAIESMLSRRFPDRWATKTNLDVTSAGKSVPVNVWTPRNVSAMMKSDDD